MNRKFFPLFLVLVFLPLAGCGKSTQSPAAGGAASSATTTAGGAASTPAATQETPPPPPLVLRADTVIPVRLVDAVDSAQNHEGDTFMASLDKDLSVDGTVVFPRDSKVEGRVTNAVPSGRLKTPAEIAITLTRITTPDGTSIPIETNVIGERAQSHKKRDAEFIGGGAGVGALIGAIAGRGKGAAIGAAVGAGAGTGGAYATGKKDIGYASETRLAFRLRSPVTINR